MTRPRPAPASRLAALAGALGALAVLTASLVVLQVTASPPAAAAARVVVTNDRGGARADTRYRTAMTVEGTGFQVLRGGFGGVYVMFGWVDDGAGGTWRPSRGGLTGQDYRYVPDAEDAADNQGYLRFVAFPGSSTASEANAVLGDDGRFSVDLVVPGPVFESVDRSGAVARVDCRTTTCGVITIGAHGVTSAANETFTPIAFGDVYGPAASPRPRSGATAAPEASASAGPAAPTPPTATDGSVPDAPLTAEPSATSPEATGGAEVPAPDDGSGAAAGLVLVTDRATAVAGRALAFTARGFGPGEQVLAVLDDGLAATGPLVAGSGGEVAGLLQLPLELGTGTHALRLTGAASGAEVAENFPVRPAEAVEPAALTASAAGPSTAGRLFLALAAVLLVVAVVDAVRRRRRVARTTQVTA